MARKRMIDPSLWTDEGMAALTPRQQLLFIGLFSNADDDGRLKGSPAALRLILPTVYAGCALGDVEADLTAVLGTMRHLRRYEVEGRTYLAFDNYRAWQKIEKPSPSMLPPFAVLPPIDREHSANGRGTLADSSPNGRQPVAPNRKEEKGTEEKRISAPYGADAPGADAPAAPLVRQPAALAVRPVPKPDGESDQREMWAAFDVILGPARTQPEKQRRGKACKLLREGHVCASDLMAAAAAWGNVMGDATMSEMGLVSHVGKLLNGPQVNGRSAGTVRRHEQKVTESALVLAQPSLADLRAQRDARRRSGVEERYAGN